MRYGKLFNNSANTRLKNASKWLLHALHTATLLLISASLIFTASGCGMVQQKQKRPQKTGPQTVEEWMAQRRVNP